MQTLQIEYPDFTYGQKVYCIYHFTWWFDPPMCGKILFKWPFRMKHHFSGITRGSRVDRKCYWYFAKMDNGVIVLMPETCIEDLAEEIKKDERMDWNKPPLHEEIDELSAWFQLRKSYHYKKRYLNRH